MPRCHLFWGGEIGYSVLAQVSIPASSKSRWPENGAERMNKDDGSYGYNQSCV